MASQARNIDLDTFFNHENHKYPLAISEFGKLSSCAKSDLIKIIQHECPPVYECLEHDAYVIDGAVIVQANHPKTSRTCGEYCSNEFPPKIVNVGKNSR